MPYLGMVILPVRDRIKPAKINRHTILGIIARDRRVPSATNRHRPTAAILSAEGSQRGRDLRRVLRLEDAPRGHLLDGSVVVRLKRLDVLAIGREIQLR